MSDWCALTRPSNPQRYETISRGFHESLRSEGCAPRRACTASDHYSFSNCALYHERRLRVTGGLAQATAFCNGRLLQPTGCRADSPISDRYRPGSVAMATRRRNPKGQLTAAYDLRTDFRFAHLFSQLDALAPPYQRNLTAHRLLDGNGDRTISDHADRPSWRNPQRR